MIEALGTLVLLFGVLFVLVGGIWFIVNAFRESLLWGLGVMFVPFVHLIFLLVEWPSARRPFGLQLFGVVLVVFACLVMSAHEHVHHWH